MIRAQGYVVSEAWYSVFDSALSNYFEKINYYGVKYDLSEDKFYRTGLLKDVATGTKPDEPLLTVQSQMRRCVINDAGVVQYYLDENNSLLKATGGAAVLDGTDGQVMVQVAKFWYKYTTSGDQKEWNISQTALTGFSVHPAFIDSSGAESDYVYMGAYPAVLYDSTVSAYIDGDGTAQYAANDKLGSVSDLKPMTSISRTQMRAAAIARGSGWQLLDADVMSMIQLLFITEYASFSSQSMISGGNTKHGAWNYATCTDSSGKSNGDGNFSAGQATTGGDSTDYVSYRGIEDVFGNIWQWVDGINVNDDGTSSKLYLAGDSRIFADGTTSNYTYAGNLAEADGYQVSLINTSLGFYPLTVGGSSSTYLTDYYYTYYNNNPAAGWMAWLVGGDANDSGTAGVFYGDSNGAASAVGSNIGGRLCFKTVVN
jgi:hypothetical protein